MSDIDKQEKESSEPKTLKIEIEQPQEKQQNEDEEQINDIKSEIDRSKKDVQNLSNVYQQLVEQHKQLKTSLSQLQDKYYDNKKEIDSIPSFQIDYGLQKEFDNLQKSQKESEQKKEQIEQELENLKRQYLRNIQPDVPKRIENLIEENKKIEVTINSEAYKTKFVEQQNLYKLLFEQLKHEIDKFTLVKQDLQEQDEKAEQIKQKIRKQLQEEITKEEELIAEKLTLQEQLQDLQNK